MTGTFLGIFNLFNDLYFYCNKSIFTLSEKFFIFPSQKHSLFPSQKRKANKFAFRF